MEHPHLSGDCTLDVSGGELSCDNVPRFRAPRLMDDGETLEVTCMMQAHEFTVRDLPDDTLETMTRQLFERDRERRDEERRHLLTALQDRDVSVPDSPDNVSWYVIELTEAETRALEEGDYPEAYQMSQSTQDADEDAGMWSAADDDDMRAMKVSGWALRNIPDTVADRAVPLADSQYDDSFFG